MSDEQLTKKERQELNRQEKNNRKANEERAESFKKIGMAIGLVVIVVGIVWAVKASRPSADEVIDVHPDPIEGPADAAIVIKEYSDFECPACQALHPVLQDIRKEYNGQVRFQYNDFPLSQHKYSTTAAVGAECAFQQDKFLVGYHRKYSYSALYNIGKFCSWCSNHGNYFCNAGRNFTYSLDDHVYDKAV